jgi:hypothetical protein
MLLRIAGFKLSKSGILTVLSGEGHILATWLQTSSLWSVSPFLAAVGLRCKALGQV